MQNLTTCACPQQDPSNCGRDIGGNRSPCYFSFVIVATSSDQTVNFRSTPFVVIGDTGVIEASLEPEWGSELQLDFSTKPICESEQRRFFACRFHDANRLQVDNCRFCEYGVINETICVHDPVQWKQEPENVFYKSWTIVLGVLLIVTLILLILTCFLCWM
uniref:Uncharacterized protein n=1 Tax=Meloidogyne javanica TaxID=6303 RepID=A0A915LXR2_MELJA